MKQREVRYGRQAARLAGALGLALLMTGPVAGVAATPVLPAAWESFLSFAAQAARQHAEGKPINSAVLPPITGGVGTPKLAPCTTSAIGVLIDLDPDGTAFAPEHGMRAIAGLAQGLASLRAQGVVIMWISRLPADRVEDIAASLMDSGLDPTGHDPILLALKEDDRKQVMRQDANDAVCIVALAGDSTSDFDELFAYLRNPADASYFETLVGQGWYLAPSPFAPNASRPGD
jgi:hypothetical protein